MSLILKNKGYDKSSSPSKNGLCGSHLSFPPWKHFPWNWEMAATQVCPYRQLQYSGEVSLHFTVPKSHQGNPLYYRRQLSRSLGIVDSSRSLGTVYTLTGCHMVPDATVVWLSCRTRSPKHKTELSQNIVLFKDREENGWNLDLYTWGLYWALTLNLTKVGHVFLNIRSVCSVSSAYALISMQIFIHKYIHVNINLFM